MHRRGFTLIEMTVVILILALFAAAIMPNAASAVESNRRRAFRLAVPRLIGQAHNEAVRSGTNVFLTATEDDGFQIVSRQGDEDQTIDTLDAVTGVSVESLLQADGSEPGEDWEVAFYPDGTSSGGVIDLDENGATYRYQIQKSSGRAKLIGEDDPLEEEKWQAGELAQRQGEGNGQ